MPGPDLTLLIDAAREAGAIARPFTGGKAKVWEKPDDAGPVTEADLAVNAMLERDLRAVRPGYGWLSEESDDDGSRLTHDTVFIIDPLDGTRSFIEGSDHWAHSLAIAHKGVVTAAVVYLPMRDKLYAAELGGGCTLNNQPVQASGTSDLPSATVLTTKPNLTDRWWPKGAPPFKRSYRPSLAYRLALVAEGRFDGMLTFRHSWEWDIAAGALLLAEAGARATDLTGKALRFNNPHPKSRGVVAGNIPVHRNIMQQIADNGVIR